MKKEKVGSRMNAFLIIETINFLVPLGNVPFSLSFFTLSYRLGNLEAFFHIF